VALKAINRPANATSFVLRAFTGLADSAGNFVEWASNPVLYEFSQKTLTDSTFGVLE